MQLIRGVLGHRRNLINKKKKNSIFTENRNRGLKFFFRFNRENEKRKKIKIRFHIYRKIECPFLPTDYVKISQLYV